MSFQGDKNRVSKSGLLTNSRPGSVAGYVQFHGAKRAAAAAQKAAEQQLAFQRQAAAARARAEKLSYQPHQSAFRSQYLGTGAAASFHERNVRRSRSKVKSFFGLIGKLIVFCFILLASFLVLLLASRH